MSRVFISYVRENSEEVQRLAAELETHGIEVWLDKVKLKPGYRWQDAIREGISQGDFFIACFSTAYYNRSKTYMNEELTLAVEELRQRASDRAWFIPVLLSECEIPNRNIGGGETLRSIQWVELYKDWDNGVRLILSVIQPDLPDESQIDIPKMQEKHWELLLNSLEYRQLTPIIGHGACYGTVPTNSQIAREWSLKYGYISVDSKNLSQVADFIARKTELLTPKYLLCEKLKSIPPPDFKNPDEPHAVLAALPISVYITTNQNDFMEQALIAHNKEPKRQLCRWHKANRLRSDKFKFRPTESTPIVYHLLGHIEEPESIVLTRDDYLEFLISISSSLDLIPVEIRKSLASSALLFFGFQLADDEFRTVFAFMRDYIRRGLGRSIGDGWQRGTAKEFAAQIRKRWEDFTERKDIKT